MLEENKSVDPSSNDPKKPNRTPGEIAEAAWENLQSVGKPFWEKIQNINRKGTFFVLFLFSCYLANGFYICSKGKMPSGDIFEWINLRCGCEETLTLDQKQTISDNIQKFHSIRDSLQTAKKNIEDIRRQLDDARAQLRAADTSNTALANRIAELEKMLAEYEGQEEKYGAQLLALQEEFQKEKRILLDSIATLHEIIASKTPPPLEQDTKKDAAIDSMERNLDIINHVKAKNIQAYYQSNTSVKVTFDLYGIDVLKRYGYGQQKRPNVLLKVIDLQTQKYIQRAENLGGDNTAVSTSVDLPNTQEKSAGGVIYFTNTQDQPFARKNEFIFELYFEGDSKILIGRSAQNLKNRPRVAKGKEK